MQLLYPIGLLALIGIIIPVLLHLWHIKTGRTLKIGSIAFLGLVANTRNRSFKINDWLLLLLRSLLIGLIALLLSQIYIQRKTYSRAAQNGWVLVPKGQLKSVYKQYSSQIDSLIKLGFELHDFNVGFKEMQLSAPIDSNYNAKEDNLTYTSLLKALNQKLPSGYEAVVFADRKLINFSGELPALNYKLHWHNVDETDKVKRWQTSLNGRNLAVISSDEATYYKRELSSEFKTLAVMIYDPFGNDENYVKAALKAIMEFTGRKINFLNWNINDVKNADIVFWLTTKPFEPYIKQLKMGAKVFTYENGKIIKATSQLNTANEWTNGEVVQLYQQVEPLEKKSKILWEDNFGAPILTYQKLDDKEFYKCYTRFNLQWTNLIWQDHFVNSLLPIILGNGTEDVGFQNTIFDQRQLSDKQQIFVNNAKEKAVKDNINIRPITNELWVLAFAVLFLERYLSFRKYKLSNGKV